jgi:hypothetical protein
VAPNVDHLRRDDDHGDMPNLAVALRDATALYPDHPAIRLADTVLT